MNPTPPPSFIKLPPIVAHSEEVDDAAIVTMLRVLELAWEYKYRKTAPYTPDELAELLCRTRATMWRHLKVLREAGWICTKRAAGRRLVIQILIPILDDDKVAETRICGDPAGGNGGDPSDTLAPGRLRQALTEIGVLGRPLRELSQMPIDPAVVRAWHLWTWHPDQDWMDNPTGYVVQRLRDEDEPPVEFLELARLADEEVQLLQEAYAASEEYCGWPSLDGQGKLRRLAPLWAIITRSMRDY
jgi:biotin operon repressor